MIALIHIYCSTSLCVIYKSLLIHDVQVLIYRGSTNERLSGEGVAYDSYYKETDRVTIVALIPSRSRGTWLRTFAKESARMPWIL